jgi:hypothetical protein
MNEQNFVDVDLSSKHQQTSAEVASFLFRRRWRIVHASLNATSAFVANESVNNAERAEHRRID